MTIAGRRGGVLLPVLIMAGILFFLSALLPQVLIQASHAMGAGVDRQGLLYSAESGLAFGEAALKQELSDSLMLGRPVPAPGWTFSPYSTNPDFGPGKSLNFKVTVLDTRFKDATTTGDQERDRFSYRLTSRATDSHGHDLTLAETGLVSITLPVGARGSGLRAVTAMSIQAQEMPSAN
jgi:hypothetical protein